MSIGVMIVDDNEFTRSGFAMMLEAEPDIDVVFEAADGREAVDAAPCVRPDVILMDVRMPRMDGIEATRLVTGGTRPPRVLILTTFDVDEYAFDGLAAGASGFLLKDVTPDQLIAAVRAVHDGDAVVTPRITRLMLDSVHLRRLSKESPKGGFESLTARELEVARAITEGLTNGEIAERLVITEGTVKVYVNRILHKLAARDRVEIVIRGYRAGLGSATGRGTVSQS